jgi:hypothetical protein
LSICEIWFVVVKQFAFEFIPPEVEGGLRWRLAVDKNVNLLNFKNFKTPNGMAERRHQSPFFWIFGRVDSNATCFKSDLS